MAVCMNRDIELGTSLCAKIRYYKSRHFVEGGTCDVNFYGNGGNHYSIYVQGNYYNATGVAKRVAGQTQSKRSGGGFDSNGWYTFETYITPGKMRFDINDSTNRTMIATDTTAFVINRLYFRYRQTNINFTKLEIRRYVEPEPEASIGESYALGEEPFTYLTA